MLPLLHDCLEYGVSGPSCQQAYLVSEYSGAKISVGVTFISLFSDYLSGLITESQSLLSDAPAIIILPVQSNILEQLLKFLSKGVAMIGSADDAFAIGEAAIILGVSDDYWTVENYLEKETISVSVQSVRKKHLKNRKKIVYDLRPNTRQKRHLKRKYAEVHKQEVDIVKKVPCNNCGTIFTARGTMIDRNLFKNSKSDGGKGYISSKDDRLHLFDQNILKVEDESLNRKKFICTLCGQTHAQRIHCQNHLESIHFPDRFKYTCTHCGKIFNGKNKMNVHVSITHKGEMKKEKIKKE